MRQWRLLGHLDKNEETNVETNERSWQNEACIAFESGCFIDQESGSSLEIGLWLENPEIHGYSKITKFQLYSVLCILISSIG